MKHVFLVTVETDERDIDAPTAQNIANEIQSNLEYETHKTGIIQVWVRGVNPLTATWIMENVICD
jgi:hypothetical protein